MVSKKPNLRRKERGVKWIGRPAGSSGSWGDDGRCQDWYRYGEMRARVPNFTGCNAKTASAKWYADKRGGEKISVGESEGTSGMTCMQRWTQVSEKNVTRAETYVIIHVICDCACVCVIFVRMICSFCVFLLCFLCVINNWLAYGMMSINCHFRGRKMLLRIASVCKQQYDHTIRYRMLF